MESYKKIAKKYQEILEQTELYILSYPGNFNFFDLKPFGLEIKKENRLSCIDYKNKDFYDALQKLDQLSFGPVGMPMDKWVFFDCGEMPGGAFGLGIRGDKLDKEILKMYGLPLDYQGMVPMSMYIAIPMANGAWFGHNLCSANSFLGDKYAFGGLAVLTKALGVKVFNIKEAFGATQWESGSMNIHLQLDDMELMSAYTPAHSFIKTMTYRSHYSPEKMLRALDGTAREAMKYDFLINVLDEEKIKSIQMEIENEGKSYSIVGRPMKKDGDTFLPIKRNR